jgi:hypothetical protein
MRAASFTPPSMFSSMTSPPFLHQTLDGLAFLALRFLSHLFEGGFDSARMLSGFSRCSSKAPRNSGEEAAGHLRQGFDQLKFCVIQIL